MAGEDHLELFSVKSNLPGSKGVVLLSPSWPPLAADLAAEDGAARGREACEDGAAIQSPRGALEQLQKVLSFSGARGHLPRGTAGLDAWMLACNDSSRAKARRRQEGTAAGWQQRLLAQTALLCWTGIDAIPAVVLLLACFSRVNSACHWAILSHAAALTLSLVPSEKPHDLELCPGAMLQALLVERQD